MARIKQCVTCGEAFSTSRVTQVKCNKCLLASKQNTIRPRICQECGATFDGGPRAWYCPECRSARKKEREIRYKKHGPLRHIGDVDICTVCGGPYIITGSLQRYCPECAGKAIREADNAASRRWNEEHNYYEHRRETLRLGVKICAVCGKPFANGTPTVTCSAECARRHKQLTQREADCRRGKRCAPPEVDVLANNGVPKSGEPGITWHKQSQKWQLVIAGQYHGTYMTVEAAQIAKNKILEKVERTDNND